MLTRSLLGFAFVALMALVVMAGGCATGGQVASLPDGSAQDSGDNSDAPSMTCTTPQIKCGSACVDPQNDSANCGGCKKACGSGEVCSDAKCGLKCSGGNTLCSGEPYDAGAPAVDAASESGPVDAGMVEASTVDAGAVDAGDASADASPHDAGHAEAGKDAGKADAGAPVPYCANLGTDPKNCGVCGKVCNANELCEDGECVPHCTKGQTVCPGNTGCAGPGECCSTMDCTSIGETCPAPGGKCACPADQTVCPSFSTCIPNTSCCDNTSCTVKGETCPTPGGTCACPTGETPCTTPTTSLCIATGTCCVDTDCPVKGETCAAPGGTCACATGDTICTASNTCISSTACCTAAECTPPPHVMATACTSGVCGIGTCVAGWVNVDGTYADGCECQDDAYGKTCATVTSEGTVSLGQSINFSGVLPVAGEENWFEITFPDYNTATFHAVISIAGAGFLFNVYDPTCASTALACADGGSSTARTVWEVSETDTNSPIDTFPAVGTAGVVYVEVYRGTGAPTCTSYTLTISD